MNLDGHPETLVASQPGNLNAVRYGVHSPRLLRQRASEIARDLAEQFTFSPVERFAVFELARSIALLEAIDADLDERGLVDRNGRERYLLAMRVRVSKQLERWLGKVEAAIERQAGDEPTLGLEERRRVLSRIAVGKDGASAADRIQAIRELGRLPSQEQARADELLTEQLANVVLGIARGSTMDVREGSDGAG